MSKKKKLKWICRRCMKTHPEVKVDHSTESLKTCSFCGVENWCFPVTSGRPVKGGKKAPKEPESGMNTTGTLVFEPLVVPNAPVTNELESAGKLVETAPEAESTEENEAIEEVAEEALEEILEEITPEEEPPEETPLEAESEPTEEELAEKQRLAEVAKLEAKLEALKK